MIKNCEKKADILPSAEEILNKAEDVCPVKWAVEVAEKAMKNTCGRGVFCRDGMKQLYFIGLDITRNKGTMEDIELLQELCATMLVAADCEMSARAIELYKLSMDNYYNEWTAHVLRHRCKAGACEGFPKPAAAAAGAGGRRRRAGGVVSESPAASAPAFDIPTGSGEEEAPAFKAPQVKVEPTEGGTRRRRRGGVVEVIED